MENGMTYEQIKAIFDRALEDDDSLIVEAMRRLAEIEGFPPLDD